MSELSPVRDRRSPQLHHSFTVKLSASGSPARWMAAIGDFSWDFATEHCGVNVLRAYDPEGKPDYLAFCYIRILGGAGFPCNAISLGDELEIRSSGFRGSSDSLSVVHQILRKSGGSVKPLESYEELQAGEENSLIVEGFHRWLVRSQADDNDALAKSAPPAFQCDHLPPIPDGHHPWRRYRPAIEHVSFCRGEEWRELGPETILPYRVDPDRDLNGVALFYFAAYFDLFAMGARSAALAAGISDLEFQRRASIEQEVVFVRNANPGDELEIVSRTRRHRETGALAWDVAVRRAGETLAIFTEIADLREQGAEWRTVTVNGNGVGHTTGEPTPAGAGLEHLLERTISEVIGNRNGPLPLDRSFGELGWDSLTRLDITARLEALFGPLDGGFTFRRTSIASLSNYLRHNRESSVRKLLSAGPVPADVMATDPARRFDPFPITDIQRAYLAGRSEAFALGGKGCHLYWEFEAEHWDVARLEATWSQIVRRHDMLRATFAHDGQRVAPETPEYRFPVHDLHAAEPVQQESALAAIRDRISHADFHPEQWPLFRIEVSILPASMRLHFCIDMLALDGPSLFLLFGQWSALYRGEALEIPAASATFRDYVIHQESQRSSSARQSALAYWAGRTLPPAPELFAAADFSAIRKPCFRRFDARIAPETWAGLQQKVRDAGLTVPAVLLAAFGESLRLWLRRPEFTINVTVASRMPVHPDIGSIAGDFTSNVLVAMDCARTETFTERAERVHEQLSRDIDHSHVSGVEVLARLSRERGEAVLMPVVFTSFLGYAGILKQKSDWSGLGRFTGGLTETPQVWLDCQALEDEDRLYLSWDMAEGVLPDALAGELFSVFRNMVDRLGRDGDAWQAVHRQLLPESQLRARRAANDTARPFPPELIHAAFLDQAQRYPDWVAVVDERRTLTYAEVRDLAARIAMDLIAAGAGRNRLVAVVMEKGWEEIAAVLAIEMAGAAYLPIDAALPPQRIRQLLEIGEVGIALTQSRITVVPQEILRIHVDTVDPGVDVEIPAVAADPHDLAYVIFTSGSTGVPKGVMIDHKGAVNTIRDINRRFAVGPRDRVLALSSLNFDLSVYDIFGVLGAGGTVVIPDPASVRDPLYLSALARRERITIWNSVPSFLQMVAEAAVGEPPIPDLRLAMLSGDWIPVQLPARLKDLCPRAKVVSLGGATEASIWSICYPIDRVDPAWKSIPYGKPLANQTFHVLNAHMEDCPDGVPGELYIGGDGVALGYWRDEEKTRASFVPHPATGARLYRTGDWGAYRSDGNIEFLGRADLQVKVGGYRIELGEIESAMAQCPGVSNAIVVTFADDHGQKRLAAFHISAGRLDPQDVRRALAARLPHYMVPAHLFPLSVFPLTRNGKVDRKALESLAAERASARCELPAAPKPAAPEEDPLVQAMASASLGLDPAERKRFVDRQIAIRTDLAGALAVPLAAALPPEAIPPFRNRASVRSFSREPMNAPQLAGLLQHLRSVDIDGQPKRRFPSAGSAYPVQVYVHIKPGRVRGIDPGIWYYHPLRHELQRVDSSGDLPAGIHAPVNQPVFGSAAFSLLLIANMSAITPLYGGLAADFVRLEAGYMGQVLMDAAQPNGLGLCPIGYLWFDGIRDCLRLGGDHILVHSFLGGVPAAVGERPITGQVDGATPHGIEDRIAAIWGDVLHRSQLNRDENFFEAGGTSFAAIEVHRRIVHELGLTCTITDLFRHPTVRTLAAHLAGNSAASADAQPDPGLSRRDRRRAARASAGGGQ